MSKNTIVIIIIASVVVGLGVLFFLLGGYDNFSSSSEDEETETSQQEQQDSSFVPTEGLAFTADITTTDPEGNVTEGELKYNGSDSWSWSADTEEGDVEMRVVDGVFYTYNDENEQWISFGTDASTSGFDTAEYNYDTQELDNFKAQAEFLGQQPCPAGTCDAWRASNYQGNESFTIAFDDQGRVSRVSGLAEDGTTVEIDYMFGKVSVEAPANAQSFNLPSNP